MKAFIVDSGVRISPFGELARDLPIGGVPLHVWQERLFRRFGIEIARVESLAALPASHEPSIVTFDNVVFTRRVVKSFLGRWRERGRDRATRLALPLSSTFVQRFSALQDYDKDDRHALFRFYGLPARWTSLESAEPLEVIYKERVLELPVPSRATGVKSWIHPITSSVCFHVRHWIHVLQANLLSIQVRWVDEIVTHPLWGLSLLLRGLLGVRGRLAWRIGAAANRIGREVDIHPTARVEGSIIGDGVRIGPQALVRGAILGEGCVIEQRADVSYSVLGAKTFVSKHSIVYATVALDEAELCMKGMQMCLVGRQAALTARATPLDVLPGRKIRVKDGDALVEIDLPILGACFGHRTFIGADVFTGPGREIPNDTKIAIDPRRVVARLPAEIDPDRFYTVRDGALVPID
jgi:carbonic anhydrase/acetyltransferase-like protein (isoleucine patch superfamily)